jgi:hypothetical protein
MVDFTTFLVAVFCFVDDWLKGKRLRQRGPQPLLSDSEVLTIEIMGEFLGLDTDKTIFDYFRRHWGDWFPNLRRIHRTTFVRQAANLTWVKMRIWRDLLQVITFDPLISIVDSFPVPVCRFARAYRCRRFAGQAAYGYDEMEKQTFYGFRAHVRISWPGVITGLELAPARRSRGGEACRGRRLSLHSEPSVAGRGCRKPSPSRETPVVASHGSWKRNLTTAEKYLYLATGHKRLKKPRGLHGARGRGQGGGGALTKVILARGPSTVKRGGPFRR